MEASSAKDAWTILKNHFERRSFSECVFIMKKICQMQLEEDGDMEDHLSKMQHEIKKLSCMGEKLSESWEVAMILRSLPESYDVLVTTLEARSDAVPSLSVVKEKLFEESRKRLQKQNLVNNNSSVMNVKNVQNKKGRYLSNPVCFYCGKSGHFKRDCIQFKESLNRNTSNIVIDERVPDENICFWLGASNNNTDWYIDSGATSHICNRKEFFEHLNFNFMNTITVANGYELKSSGIGSGYLNILDGNGNTTKVQIKDVLYVPNI